MDRQSGKLHPPGTNGQKDKGSLFWKDGKQHQQATYSDKGGASRFFPRFGGEDGSNGFRADSADSVSGGEGSDAPERVQPPDRRGEGGIESVARFPRFDTEPGFQYVAKASRAQRNAGLEGMPEAEHQTHNHVGRDMSKPTNAMGAGERKRVERGEVAMRPAANSHPTVKPLALMDWLCKLICPPGGVILDPFMGSGSTGCSAVRLGFDFIGIEREPEYLTIAEKRISFWASGQEAQPDKPRSPSTPLVSGKSDKELQDSLWREIESNGTG